MGSALKNTGVQPLLDAVIQYLPAPDQVKTKSVYEIDACVCVCVFLCFKPIKISRLIFFFFFFLSSFERSLTLP